MQLLVLAWAQQMLDLNLSQAAYLQASTAIGVMAGAVLFLGEPMIRARWVAAGIGFLGVLIVVAPGLRGDGGYWNLVMLASTPLFAASFLITKALTRHDKPEVIVAWQSIMVALFTLPFAVAVWHWPSAEQWAWFVLTGILGSVGHWFLTEAFRLADMSAIQPVKFLDLIWASLMGWLVFSETPALTTYAGALVIFAATTWIARREARR
ncbi:MAG: DMT family transporter [Acetobacteraceae bacterium]|nr:DMT family transporter [Acetobacteraceae bacterium]